MRVVGRCRISAEADADIEALLRYTGRQFGPRQRQSYATILDRAIRLIDEDPARPGSRDRSDLLHGLRSLALHLASPRRRGTRHVVFYRVAPEGPDILRVLHEAMDPTRHLAPPDDTT